MAVALQEHDRKTALEVLRSPLLVLALVAIVLVLLLCVPLQVPIGPMYWDLFIYFDAANRIFNGQVPVVDFFVPVGPLGYYLFAGGLRLFSHAQPLLLVSWSMLAVTGPLMALVLWQVDRRSRGAAFAVLVPFLVFAVLPFNSHEYFPYPGSDGFGIYNRQSCQLLYALVAALVFVPGGRLLVGLVAAAMTALFLTKITGFVAGFLICAFAFVAGRMSFRQATASALAFFATLGVLELGSGMVSQYMLDIIALIEINTDELLPRFLHAGANTFGIVASGGLLALVLFWGARQHIAGQWQALRRSPSGERLTALLDQDWLWLCVILFAGLFFETQNTGSQPLIFVWPLIVSIIASRLPLVETAPKRFAVIAVLSGAAVLPPLVHVIHRATRTYASTLIHVPLRNDNLKTLGSVNARPEILMHARELMDLYSEHRAMYRDLVEADMLPAFMYYLQYDFQLAHLMAIDRAVTDIRALEAEKRIRFDTMMELNFVDPIPYLMGRQSPKYIAIGADPTRAVPPPGSQEENAVRDTDLVLYPTCPLTTDNRELYELYKPALKDDFRITLDPCFDAFVHPKYAEAFGKTPG